MNKLDYLLIIIVCAITLFFKIGEIPPLYPWSDESEIAADAVATLAEGPRLFYPAQLAGGSLAVWLEAGWMALFGRSLAGLRILNGLVNLISALLLYRLARLLFQRRVALVAALLFGVSTWLLGLGRVAAPNWSLVPPLITLALLWFWQGLQSDRRLYFLAAGGVMGLLFYGYIPGYVALLIPILFVAVGPDRRRAGRLAAAAYLPLAALVVAGPILLYFAGHPAALLQRPWQLADTNELSGLAAWGQSLLDMGATFGLGWWRIEHLAFDPLVTVLFLAGLWLALRRWRESAYLLPLVWWAVMIAPAFLSRSAGQGFIFEVWRRGVGAQPVSFIFSALAVDWLYRRIGRQKMAVGMVALVVMISAGLSYRLYFGRWANSGAMTALFAREPVQLVDWLETTGETETRFLFPIRPYVSPTTRPELFTVRYLYSGQASLAFPPVVEGSLAESMPSLFAPETILLLPDRIEVDPKGYLPYLLGIWGQPAGQSRPPGYTAAAYRLWDEPVWVQTGRPDVAFGGALRLVEWGYRGPQPAPQRNLSVGLRWRKESGAAVDYNAALILFDANGFERTRADKPLLSAADYRTSRHWPPGAESTIYYSLPVPPDTPPGRYSLRVAAYETATGARLPPAAGSKMDLSLELWQPQIEDRAVTAGVEIPRPLDVRFPGGLRLAGLDSSAREINRPGDRLRVTLWWRTDRPPEREIGLGLALAGPDRAPVPLMEEWWPLIPDYPTTVWPADRLYRAHYSALLPATLKSGEYLLALRLVDLADGETIAEHLLGPVTVQARAHIFEAPALDRRIEADFGGLIRLVSYSLEPDAIRLQWQALGQMREPYKVFVHLTDAEGRLIDQVDTIPAAPTTGWLPGEIIVQEIALPSEAVARAERLLVGLYNAETGRRLSVEAGNYVAIELKN